MVQRGGDWAGLFAVPNVTAHSSTASVPVTVLLCNSPLLCSFNVGIKGYSDRNPSTGLMVQCAGAYPCLQFRFKMRRDIGYFLIQVYVPSILIVILSWVSFWINVDASPARVSIGLLTVLTTTTMSSVARSSLPRVSYIKVTQSFLSFILYFAQ